MIPAAFLPLAAHLWQSTLFAALAALLSLALRRNQARVRYWLWLVASYKFLLPFSWLVSIGHHFTWHAVPQSMPPAISALTGAVSGPTFLISSPAGKLSPAHPSMLPFIISGIWVCGFAVLAFGWVREWMRIRAIRRSASPLPLGLAIPVMSTPVRLEPGVFGIFQPVLLLPEGIASHLTHTQLQGVLAHELCHVRRRDNLTAAIHMLVEALFWFHPLVWWLGGRLIDERERACDEEVLRIGGEPEAYAEGILTVCRSYIESPVACVSGISGSDLKKRIVRIMTQRLSEKLSFGRKVILAAVSIAAIAGPLGFGLVNAAQILVQSPTAEWEAAAGGKRSFDVVSVKPSASGEQAHSNVGLNDLDDGLPEAGHLSAVKIPLSGYIAFAYKLRPYQGKFVESQLPKWAAAGLNIEARAEGNPTKDQMRLMMQSLLADRFQLAVHFETRELPVLALGLAQPGKTGPQLQPHTEDPPCSDIPIHEPPPGVEPTPLTKVGGLTPACGGIFAFLLPHAAPSRFHIEGRNLTMGQIASYMVPTGHLDREILDNTGLNGNFDFCIEFVPGQDAARPRNFRPDPSGTKFAEALQQQLGLRLDPQTGLVNVLIVDHVEEPSAN